MREKPLMLIVDDESSFLEIVSTKLTASGFDVITASNGREGIEAAKRSHPDLILMDIRMPGGSGTDAALAIKQDPSTKDVKIAFLSSMGDPWPSLKADRFEISKEIGMEEFIDKTEDLNVLVDKIKAMLAK